MNAPARIATLLFVPGTRPDRFPKALATAADTVCIDLEDAVPEQGKAEARAAALKALESGDPRLSLRINGLKTRAGLADLAALAHGAARPRLILVPKAESPAEVAIVGAALGSGTAIVPLIESVRGLDAAREIAHTEGVAMLMFGGGDLAAEIGVEFRWEPLLTSRSLLVLACARAGIEAMDAPYLGLQDEAGLIAETRAAKALGFSAKSAIHPAQVQPIRAALSPTDTEVAEAEEAERVFAAAGGAAVRFRDRVLDVPIMRRYQRILAMRSKRDA
jgi:citrate lyase beta subunit